jgi:polysaccharide deacetylase family protein (PEP-CTERM system associated)
MIMNALTIDVEDYFQVHAFSNVIQKENWDSFKTTVEKNTHLILDLLDYYDGPRATYHRRGGKPTATFFILGWIAERYPQLVKEIYKRGHEVACHGYAHQCIFNQTQEEFKEDIKKSKSILEDLTGEKIIGYRAPTYSIKENTLWALKILSEEGFTYDSSIFPIRHDYYGFPQAPRFPFIWDLNGSRPEIKPLDPKSRLLSPLSSSTDNEQWTTDKLPHRKLYEFPLSTVRFLEFNLPCAGGGYFRLFPYMLTRTLINFLNNKGKPFIFYFHPWEVDKNLPEVKGANFLEQFRTRINLKKTEGKLKKLLQDFKFSSLKEILDL